MDKFWMKRNMSRYQVQAEITKPGQISKLFSFGYPWNQFYKHQLFQLLKETHTHLIKNPWEDWGRNSRRRGSLTIHLLRSEHSSLSHGSAWSLSYFFIYIQVTIWVVCQHKSYELFLHWTGIPHRHQVSPFGFHDLFTHTWVFLFLELFTNMMAEEFPYYQKRAIFLL